MNRALIGTVTLFAGVTVAALAFAAPRDGGFAGPMGGGMRGAGPALCVDPAAEIAGKVAFAEKRLSITDAQRPAWKKLVDTLQSVEPKIKASCDAMKTHRDAMKARIDAKELPTAIEKLEFAATATKSAAELIAAIQPAAVDLYNQLTPDQKKIADGLLPGGRFGHDGPRGPMGDHRGRR